MEIQNASNQSLFDLKIDETSKDHILKTSLWAMVIVVTSVVGYILRVIRYATHKNDLPQAYERLGLKAPPSDGSTLASMVIQILIGGLVIFFLYQFASSSKKGVLNMNQSELNRGFNSLKTYFLIIGVLIILAFVFALFGILAAGAGNQA